MTDQDTPFIVGSVFAFALVALCLFAINDCHDDSSRRECVGWCLQDCTIGQPPSWCAEACR